MSYTEKLAQMKRDSNLSIQHIAEKSGVPASTITRILNGQTEEPTFSNMAKVVKAMGGSLDELVGIEPKTVTVVESKTIYADERLTDLYEKTIKDKNKWIAVLFAILTIVLVAVIALFIYDFTHPDRGWYQEAIRRMNESGGLGSFETFLQTMKSWFC